MVNKLRKDIDYMVDKEQNKEQLKNSLYCYIKREYEIGDRIVMTKYGCKHIPAEVPTDIYPAPLWMFWIMILLTIIVSHYVGWI